MSKLLMNCPNGHGKMVIRNRKKKITFRCVDISVPSEQYVCPVCDLEASTVDQTASVQKEISDEYRKAVNLLTGRQIVEKRKNLTLTQEDLAKKMNVGIASIKRWEGGTIQSKSMDHALRIALEGKNIGDSYTGNRSFSIPRIKLVLNQFESILGRRIIKKNDKNDKMLFAAKYLWYADMVAHREAGESMTGSTYAALPYGPQLNNYKDLIDDIMKANESRVEPLSAEEKRIISRIAKKFPKDAMVYDAAHKETIWKKQSRGAIIPYTDSIKLTGI